MLFDMFASKKLRISKWPYYDSETISKVQEVLNSGEVNYRTNNNGKLFEKEFSSYIGLEYGIAHANGSLALTNAFKSLNLKPGDEVITTPRSFIATVSAAVLEKLVPVFADVDLDSGNITAETIEPLISKSTKAICVVHLAGWPADMLSIRKLADAYRLPIIEDCSQAHGASISSKKIGSFGDISVWSFCQDKIISTGGEGGMVTTSNKDLYEKMWSFKDHGKSRKKLLEKNNNNEFVWMHDDFGNNFRLTEMQSVIGRVQLKKLEAWIKKRKKNAMTIKDAISDLNCVRTPYPNSELRHSYYKYYVYLNEDGLASGWDRKKIMNELLSYGAPCFTGSCGEIYLEGCFKKANIFPKNKLKCAKQLSKTSLMFLCHPTISDKQLSSYAEIIKDVLKKASR